MQIKKLSKKQKEILRFIKTADRALICDGSVRSGKTSIMSVAFLVWAMANFDRTNFAICGKTVQSVERNVLRPLMEVEGLPFSMRYKVSTRMLVIRCDNRENNFYLFGGKDESSYALIQGITLAGVLFDEVALMPQSFVQQANARTITYSNAKLWFNCNPENPNHYFYKEWIKNPKPNTKHIRFYLEDNPILSYEQIERVKEDYTGVFYQRYILGEWVAAEGIVYPMFDKAKHVKEVSPHYNSTYYISMDYGTLNPTAMGLWCVYDGKAHMLKEYYYSGRDTQKQKTDEEYYTDLEEFAEGYEIERVIIDPSAASFKETIRRHGRFSVQDANNSVVDGIRLTGSLLNAGRITFDPSCEHTFEEFGLYRWDEKSQTDAVIKENDHAMDQIRYMMATIMRREIR